MKIDKNRVRTQDETGDDAPIDKIRDRVDAKMKTLKGRTKRTVAESLGNEKQKHKGRKLEEEGKKDLEAALDE